MENQQAALSVDEAFRYVGISRALLYRLMDSRAIPSFHIGRRRLILREHLDAFLKTQLAAAGYTWPDGQR